jgi:hypothetical protein
MSQFALKLSTEGNVEIIPFVENQLKTLQDAVGGGYVEAITLADDLVLWVNEDGKSKQMPFNQAATSIFIKHRGGSDFIVGPVVFTGGTDEDGDTLGISEGQIHQVKTYAAMSQVS